MVAVKSNDLEWPEVTNSNEIDLISKFLNQKIKLKFLRIQSKLEILI